MIINDLIQLINKRIEELLPSENSYNKVLIDSMDYSLTSGGKRLRPLLMLGSCMAVGGKIEDAIDFACAMEFIHTYSLIHDDLPCLDNDDFRRNVPTNHKKFGEDIALLAGDGLLSLAFKVLSNAIDNTNYKDHLNAVNVISEAAFNMVQGQIADIQWSNNNNIDDLKYIYNYKTGALIYASLLAGAYIGHANNDTLNAFKEFGTNFGMAFQIADDIDDADSDEGPNIVHLIGLDNSKQLLNEKLDICKSILNRFDNTEVLDTLIDLIHK